jgi:hypothetical protein
MELETASPKSAPAHSPARITGTVGGPAPARRRFVAGVKAYTPTSAGFSADLLMMSAQGSKIAAVVWVSAGSAGAMIALAAVAENIGLPPAAIVVSFVVVTVALCVWAWRTLMERISVEVDAQQIRVGSQALARAEFQAFAIVREFTISQEDAADIEMAEIGVVHRGAPLLMGRMRLVPARALVAQLNAWVQASAPGMR